MKKLLMLALSLAMLLSSIGATASAATESDKQVFQEPTIVSERFVDPTLVGTSNADGIMTLDDYNEIPVVRETITTYKTVEVTPTKQPPLGYEGGSGATVFFFSTGGNNVKFSVTINSKYVTFTAETGSQNSSGSGYGAKVPDGKGCYKFQFIKHYTITTKIIDVYQYSQYKYSYEIHDPKYSLNHRWVKV